MSAYDSPLFPDSPVRNAKVQYKTYCTFCGHLIQSEAVFCPNCGNHQPQQEIGKTLPSMKVVDKSRRKRTLAFLICLLLFVVAFYKGSQIQLSRDEALAMMSEFEEAIGMTPTAERIIIHNTALCLQFFVPVLGIVSLGIVAFSSGNVLAAIALSSPYPISATDLFTYTLATPVAWVELAAYGLASSEGIMIVISLFSRSLRKEMRNLILAFFVSISLLILGGFLEVFLIEIMQNQGFQIMT